MFDMTTQPLYTSWHVCESLLLLLPLLLIFLLLLLLPMWKLFHFVLSKANPFVCLQPLLCVFLLNVHFSFLSLFFDRCLFHSLPFLI